MGGLEIPPKALPCLDPGFSGEEERKEIKNMFGKVTLVQWHPETEAMAEVMKD